MPTVRSTRCCGSGPPFGSASLFQTTDRSEVHVTLQNEPCCKKEFKFFLSVLADVRTMIGIGIPFYLLMNLTRCGFNPSYLMDKEKSLSGSVACSIVLPKRNIIMRSAVKLIVSVQRKGTRIKVHDTMSDGIRWIRACTDSHIVTRTTK